MAMLDKPKLILRVQVRRSRYMRRFLWSLLASVATAGGLAALLVANERPDIELPPAVLTVGQIAALLALVYFGLRTLTSLWRGLRNPNQDIRFFNRGFTWKRGKQEYKYSWGKLESIRNTGRGIYLGERPLLQLGAIRLTMSDGQTLKLRGIHGDLRKMDRTLRRYTGGVTGTRMGRALREHQPVKIHRRLTVLHDGLAIGKDELSWRELDVQLKNRTLIVYRKDDKGKFKRYKAFNTRQITNLYGFMEIAKTTIRHYQPERFNIKVQVPHVQY